MGTICPLRPLVLDLRRIGAGARPRSGRGEVRSSAVSTFARHAGSHGGHCGTRASESIAGEEHRQADGNRAARARALCTYTTLTRVQEGAGVRASDRAIVPGKADMARGRVRSQPCFARGVSLWPVHTQRRTNSARDGGTLVGDDSLFPHRPKHYKSMQTSISSSESRRRPPHP